ncbi:glucosamine/fructose-6-phosphate aminotransferase [Halovivax asiaticus JCM 14624]|uniref:Glutamine--fructose-6-phosphate aminotransferase [isomerizing] n=1 Tax=Halovivax asiaticus JCM 14624 TaxID=1227490 RepID=M0BMY9_9EURY|nr:glutamine--fructose-6-phosphate transaminase (isomerizing) [Halovivax asiaticus]ELZ10974.1 glucosamine/fructose-6-phosphate aminotransferase [Halovivax asiaticus JCM 14624]
MCGIIARVGEDDGVDRLLGGLERLEYRGYDSAGIAVENGTGLAVRKASGEVTDLKQSVSASRIHGGIGIGHTRWSTHGPPTDDNAHPHTDTTGEVAVVHNGVIDNHAALRRELEAAGCEFTSDTDTEVVPHRFERYLSAHPPEEAFRKTVRDLDGSYAIAAMVEGVDAVFAARRGSPLVLGVSDEEYFLASDVPAFLEHTDEVIYFEDDEIGVITPDHVEITTLDGRPVERASEVVAWDAEETSKGEYPHYMRKEIEMQDVSLANAIQGRIDDDGTTPDLDPFPPGTFAAIERIQFVACGTSFHAAKYGAQLLNNAGIPAQSFRASEYDDSIPVDEQTLVVAVTQSGETADTLRAFECAASGGARTVAVTNVVGSTAAREADDALFIRAGPEIGVAATKTFSSQVVVLSLLAHRVSADVADVAPWDDPAAFYDALERLPEDVRTVLDRGDAERVAEEFLGSDAFFFIGRGPGYPVAIEGALKFKEITYEHAEGFAAGELKHGPLALVTPRTPVFTVVTGDDNGTTVTNAEEAQTRGAPIVAVSAPGHRIDDVADASLQIPASHPDLAGLLANVQLQLLSYHTADRLGRAIDKPRNLAKSVTVE